MAHNTTHLDLVVQQHPQNLFFKDKGGKRNQLNFKISLGPHRGLTLLKPIPLKLGLYTEHDSKVEDEDVNKKVLWTHKENYEITPEDEIVDIWFRIEKVSSKLGLFKIYVGPGKGGEDVSSYFTRNNKQPCPPGSVVLNSVYSSLIEVRSKVNELGNRPRNNIDSNGNIIDPSHTGSLLLSSLGELTGNDGDESALAGAVTQIGEALHHVSSAVTTLEQRISILHKRLAVVEAQLGTNGVPSSSSSSSTASHVHQTTSANRSNSNNVNAVNHSGSSFTAQVQYGDNATKESMLLNTRREDAEDDDDDADDNMHTMNNHGNDDDTDSDDQSEAPYEVQTNDFASTSTTTNMAMNNLHTPANATVQLHSMNGALPPTLAAAVAAANTSSHHSHNHPHLNTPGGPTAFMGHVMQPSAVRMSSPNLMGSPNWGMSITGSPPGLNLGANAMGTGGATTTSTTMSSNTVHPHHHHTANATTLSSSSSSVVHHGNVNTVNNFHPHHGTTTVQATTTTGTELPSAVSSGGGSPTADPSYVLRSLTVPSTYDALFTAPISNPPIPNLTGLVGHRDSFDYADPNANELYGHSNTNDNDAVDGHMFENAMDNDGSNVRAGSGSNRRGAYRKRSIVVEHGVEEVMSGTAKRGRPGRAYSDISIGNAWDGGALGMTGMGVGNSLNISSNALTPTNVLMTAGLQPFSDSGVQIMVAHNPIPITTTSSGHASNTNSGGGGRSSPSSNITSSSTNSGVSRSAPRSATRGRSAVAEAAALDAMNEAAGRHTVVDALAMLGRDVRGNP